MASDSSSSDFASPEHGSFPFRFKRKPRYKDEQYGPVKKRSRSKDPAAKNILASEVDSVMIDEWFGPEFINCPDTGSGVGTPIHGGDVNSVLDSILQQLQPVGFPIQSLDQFERVFKQFADEDVQARITEFCKLMSEIFDPAQIENFEAMHPHQRVLLYQTLRNKARSMKKTHAYSVKSTVFTPAEVCNMLRQIEDLLSEFVTGTYPMCTDQMHKALTQFFKMQIQHLLCASVSELDVEDKKAVFVQSYTRENGHTTCSFDLELTKKDIDDWESRKRKNSAANKLPSSPTFRQSLEGVDAPPQIITDSSSSTTSTDSTKKQYKPGIVNCVSTPDLTMWTQMDTYTDGELTNESRTLAVILEVKSPKTNLPKARDKSDSSMSCTSDQDEVSSSKNQRTATPDERRDTKALKTQHFFQMLCAMKFQPTTTLGNAPNLIISKPFCDGIFCVSHRLYVSRLAVCHRQSFISDDVVRNHYVSFSKTASDLKKHPRCVLKMASTDYLCIFNTVHLEAILKFVAVLAFVECLPGSVSFTLAHS